MCDWMAFVGKPSRRNVNRWIRRCTGLSNTHALGVALHTGSNARVLKAPITGSEFVELPEWHEMYAKMIEKTKFGMVHARLATDGNPYDNVNNHPHFTSNGSVLVHKGVVSAVVEDKDAKSECDSEQILLAVEKNGLTGVENTPGWMHLAFVPHYQPDVMWFFTNSSKLHYWEHDDRIYVTTIPVDGPNIYVLPMDQWVGVKETGELVWGPQIEPWKTSRFSQQKWEPNSDVESNLPWYMDSQFDSIALPPKKD
tara:strand:+ start:8106 stop:8867 length:762 start_codon:yes stop_codon:yes gene_type:complete